jgi:hypothetical protein
MALCERPAGGRPFSHKAWGGPPRAGSVGEEHKFDDSESPLDEPLWLFANLCGPNIVRGLTNQRQYIDSESSSGCG